MTLPWNSSAKVSFEFFDPTGDTDTTGDTEAKESATSHATRPETCPADSLRQDFVDDFAAIDGGTLVASVMKEGQIQVVDAKAMQDGGMDVVNV